MNRSSEDAFSAFTERLYDQNKFAIKLGLDNVERALELLGHPEKSHRAIVVGGTNGKGETSAYLSNILQSSGLDVGFFSSPHLVEFNERFRVNGRPVAQEKVTEVGSRMLELFTENEGHPSLTFFEIATVMATVIFSEEEVDVAIYEVGLGGRLDAVNAISRELVVITNIGFDHQQYLGNSLDEIVFEKMSLAKASDAVIGPQSYEWSSDFQHEGWQFVSAERHQNWNRETAFHAARTFLGDGFDPEIAEQGARLTRWPGRFDFRDTEFGQLLFDAGHNPDGLRYLAQNISASGHHPTKIFWGMMRDKAVTECLSILRQLDVPIVGVPIQSDRALDRSELLDLGVEQISSTQDADLCDGAMICGSVFLVGEFFDRLGLTADIRRAV